MSFAAVGSSAAHAASDYSGAVYQITWSLNCDHPSCAPMFGLGGFWGWVALMPSSTPGTGPDNGQETGCGHSGPGGGPHSAGAGHNSIDSTWSTVQVPPGVLPVTDPTGNYLNINDPGGLFPVPATYGHYTFNVDGASGQIQVSR